MYRIIKTDGTELGAVDSILYIRIGSSGDYTLTTREKAIGIAYNKIVYNLVGHNEIPDAETVVISAIDTNSYITPLIEQGATALEIAIIETQQMITELDLRILEG